MKIVSLVSMIGTAVCLFAPQNSLAQGSIPNGWHAQIDPGPYDSQPDLNGRPTVTRVLFLDTDGTAMANTTTPGWNGSNPFSLGQSGLTGVQMREVYEHVKEDFLPFNINVTTEEARYTSAAASPTTIKRSMHIKITQL